MAWSLADAGQVCLTDHEHTMLFVELGSGEHHLAIERILKAVVSRGMALPAPVLKMLTRWLDVCGGSPEEPRLRRMLVEVQAHQRWRSA